MAKETINRRTADGKIQHIVGDVEGQHDASEQLPSYPKAPSASTGDGQPLTPEQIRQLSASNRARYDQRIRGGLANLQKTTTAENVSQEQLDAIALAAAKDLALEGADVPLPPALPGPAAPQSPSVSSAPSMTGELITEVFSAKSAEEADQMVRRLTTQPGTVSVGLRVKYSVVLVRET